MNNLKNNQLKLLYSASEISGATDRLANVLSRDYDAHNPLLIGILKGSIMFMADLARKLEILVELDFICLSSYGSSKKSSGEITLSLSPKIPVEGRHVLLVEDIVDTGLTTGFAIDYISSRNPASLKLCSLLDKKSRRQRDIKIDYLGFSAPDEFLVGYGLDCNEEYRNLPAVYILGDCKC